MTINPFRPVHLGATVALSTVLSGGVSTLPPGNLPDVARALVGFCGVALSTKVVCETLADDANFEATAQESEVQAALTRDLYRANAAYYREFPHHWKARKPVPDEWLELWGQTGGKPYLALHPSSPQLITPIAQPQPQPQTIQQPGQTRESSFDRAAASESPGTGWGDYEPRPQPPIAQTPIFSAPIAQTPTAPYTPVLFDWRLIQQRPDKFPHVCVVGASGDGKTATQEWIARSIAGGNHLEVLSTKRKSDQWIGLEVVGLGRNFPPVSSAWHDLENELDRRWDCSK